jgi:ribosome maturation factor RimP
MRRDDDNEKERQTTRVQSLAEQIEALITPSVTAMGFHIVLVKLSDSKQSRLLQIMAEKPGALISLDECAAISRQISAVLDVEDLIPGEYRLEVGSPGIDRPLVKLADFAAYAGHVAKIETSLPIEGRKRFSGKLKPVEGETVIITVDNRDYDIPFIDIASAKLVLTDELMKKVASGQSPVASKKKEHS